VALLTLSGLVPPAGAQSGTTVRIENHPTLGPYLVNGGGSSLYLFEEDRRDGDRGREVESDCSGECLDRWPPLLAGEGDPVAGPGADPALVGVFVREDGRRQVMYNGWPLYFYWEDFVPGDTHGHDLDDSGGEWYLLTPAGWGVGVPADEEEGGRQREDDDRDD